MNSFKTMLVQIINMMLTSFNGGPSGSGAGASMQAAITIMSFSEIDARVISAAFSFTTPIAFSLMVANCLVGFCNANMRDHEDGVHAFARAGIWLVLSDCLLNFYIGPIAGWIMGLSMSAGHQMMDKLGSAMTTFPITTIEDLDKGSIIALVIALLIGFFGWLMQFIAILIITVVCFSAKIELMFRICFCPFGIAALANPEQHHDGMRYMKKLLASGFYCAAIVLVLYIANVTNLGSLLGSATDPDSVGFIGKMLVVIESTVFIQLVAPLAAIGSITVAKSIINESFGA